MYILEALLFLAIVILTIYLSKFYNYKKSLHPIEKFSDYIGIIEYFKEKAYGVIYKDKILTHSLEGFKLSDQEFNAITEDFVRLVIKFLGPRLFETFVYFYGNEETFILGLVEYFSSRYEDDEIRKSSLDKLSSNDSFPEVQND